MTIQDLITRLRDLPEPLFGESVDDRREEWICALKMFLDDVENWLRPAIDVGLLKVSRQPLNVVDGAFGHYIAPRMFIHSKKFGMKLDPVCLDQVDFLCGPMRVALKRTATKGWVVTPLRGVVYDLTEDTFTDLLAQVML